MKAIDTQQLQKSVKYFCYSFDGILGVSADSAYLSKY